MPGKKLDGREQVIKLQPNGSIEGDWTGKWKMLSWVKIVLKLHQDEPRLSKKTSASNGNNNSSILTFALSYTNDVQELVCTQPGNEYNLEQMLSFNKALNTKPVRLANGHKDNDNDEAPKLLRRESSYNEKMV